MMEPDDAARFTADSPLSGIERGLIEAVERGEEFRPTAWQARSSGLRGGLLRAILLGTPLKHHPRTAPAGAALAVSVTSNGIRIAGPEAGPPAPVPVAGPSAARPQLRITGPLDLASLAAGDGGFLPALRLCGCSIDQPIDMSGTHLQSLRLEKCRFSRLVAGDARFNGSVRISDCGPRRYPKDRGERGFLGRTLAASEDEVDSYRWVESPVPAASRRCRCSLCAPVGTGDTPYDGCCDFCCEIDLQGAQIGTQLELSRTYLRAPRIVGRSYRTPKVTDSSAAFLDGVNVGGGILIQRCVFVGRTSARSATVANDVRVHGGRFISAAQRSTFDFKFASIGGMFVLGAQEASREEQEEHGVRAFPIVVIGHVSGLSMSANEVWIGEGFYFGHDPLKRGGHATINFGKCDVGRTFKVGTYHPFNDQDRPSGGAWIQGEICLTAANFGKNLEIHGVDYDGIFETLGLDDGFYRFFGVERETPHLRLSGQGLKVDRRAFISKGRFHDADALPPGSSKSRKPSAVDLWKSTIGTGLRMEALTRCVGAIRLNSCVIGREVIIRCSDIEASLEERNKRRLDRRIPCLLDIGESVIEGHVKIGRTFLSRRPPPSTVSPPADAAAAPGSEASSSLRIEGGISFQGTTIQGSILIGHVTIDLSRGRIDLPSPPTGAGDDAEATSSARAAAEDALEPVQLRRKAAGENARIALDFRGCECRSDLEVRSLCWKLPKPVGEEGPDSEDWFGLPSAAPADPGGEVAAGETSIALKLFDRFGKPFGLSGFRQIQAGFFAIVDLRGFRCATLLDGFGADWGLIYRIQLRVAGMKIGDVEPVCHHDGSGPSTRPERHRLRWLAYQHSVQRATHCHGTPSSREMPRIYFPERLVSTWRDDFVPQAYDVFSSAYRSAGENLTGDRILIEKKDNQNALYFWRLLRRWYSWDWFFRLRLSLVVAAVTLFMVNQATGAVFRDAVESGLSKWLFAAAATIFFLWPFVASGFQLLFKQLFLYGASTERALLVFTVSIAIGWGGVHAARHGQLGVASAWLDPAPSGILPDEIALVREVEDEPGNPDTQSERAVSGPRAAGTLELRDASRGIMARPSPCDRDVSSLLYALDLFIPLIDLDQELRCTIRPSIAGLGHDSYFWWRFAKALYELLGWIITSLLILTISGVLRRDLER